LSISKLKYFFEGILNSYSQVFFSDKYFFSIIILFVTLFDLFAGVCGIFAIIVSNLLALNLGFDKEKIRKGYYGFNSLLVGLGTGFNFDASLLAVFILILAAIFTFFLTVAFESILGKYTLPYLSLPFIFSLWTILVASREFQALGLSTRGIYTLNDLYLIGGGNLVYIYEWWNNLEILPSLRTYFISLGAIFFQFNVQSGILVAIGLLIYSRIAFLLTLLGFYSAYIFYYLIDANITVITYSYIGFNYILTSIAIGGFFIIPSKSSYLWVVVLIPIVAIITISLNGIFTVWQLPLFSLPFNIVVIIFLYVLKLRVFNKGNLILTAVQYNSPEKNFYYYHNSSSRYKNYQLIPFKLPVLGKWFVSQAHNGNITHKSEWRHAWDFVITDGKDSTFKGDGVKLKDYYCYDKTVLAPADGTVVNIIDDIPENLIGDVNLVNNWGNTIVIKHADYLYSGLSHLKPGSIKVKHGDFVKAGSLIALCGSSGRSPEPHLHFQIQSSPNIGSYTLEYPISDFISFRNGSSEFKSYEFPGENTEVSNIETSSILKNAFDFTPGREINFEFEGKNINWEVSTDVYNNSYLFCEASNSYAYFKNDGSQFYFTSFYGDKKSLLYYFFIGVYKVLLGVYKDIKLEDKFPLDLVFSKIALIPQDVAAPFYVYLDASYEMRFEEAENYMNPKNVKISSCVKFSVFGVERKRIDFGLLIDENGFHKFDIILKEKTITAICSDRS
jgi:urea transporter/murein DD-endopeptidase MepM/ murein hydrolase activator NlpD